MRRNSSFTRTQEKKMREMMREMASKGERSPLCSRELTSKSLILMVKKVKEKKSIHPINNNKQRNW